MKALHIYVGNLFGGIETLLVTLARERHLCPEMEPQFALCFQGRLSQNLADTGVKVHQIRDVKLRYPWQVIQARAQLERVILQESIDIVICHSHWPQFIFGGVAKRLNKPLVFWCNYTPTRVTNSIERLSQLVQPNLVIANSKYTQKQLHLLYPNIVNQVIYYPVTPIKIDNPHLVRQQIRHQLGTAADTTVIIHVSRLEHRKGHTLTIASLGEMKDSLDWECWIVGGVLMEGEENYQKELIKQVQQLGLEKKIRFLGQRQDVPNLLIAADIFCHPNMGSGEPFGIVFIEALYAGLPVLTVAVGGGGEIVTSECGYAVQPERVDEITHALQELIQNPLKRERFRAAAIKRASELCDPQQQITTINKIFSKLCILQHQ